MSNLHLNRHPFGNTTGIKHLENIGLQNYIDNSFRLTILLYMLSVATLHFAQKHVFLLIIVSSMVFLALSYSLYITATIGNDLQKIEGYEKFNIAFYYVEIILLLLLYIALIFLYFKDGEKIKSGNFS